MQNNFVLHESSFGFSDVLGQDLPRGPWGIMFTLPARVQSYVTVSTAGEMERTDTHGFIAIKEGTNVCRFTI